MSGENELLAAVKAKDAHAVRALVDRDPSLARMRTENGTVILTALYYGARDALKVLLERVPEDALNTHEAAAHGNLELVRMLLEYGADANAVRDGGNTPADDAQSKGHEAVAGLLRTRGAKPSAK